MKTNDSPALYANGFMIAEENRVRGFDPLRFVQMTANGPKLPLKIKQTWFRLKYPEGRIHLHAVNVTQQLALIEARVFLHKTDGTPQYTTTVQRMLNEVPGGLFVQAAQNAAVEQVLDEAGFTVRFTDDSVPSPVQAPVVQSIPNPAPQPAVKAETVSVPVNKPVTEPVSQTAVPVKQQIQIEPTPVVEAVPVQPAAKENTPPITAEQTHTAITNAAPSATPDVETITVPETAEEAMAIPSPVPTAKPEEPAEDKPSVKVLEPITIPVEEVPADEAAAAASYTNDMSVDEICSLMTVDEALNYVVTSGSCKGLTMAQAMAKRPASVRFYTTPGYKGEDNILRASAKIVLEETAKLMAS